MLFPPEKGFDEINLSDAELVSTHDLRASVHFDTVQLGKGYQGELDGLVHISALADRRTTAMPKVVFIDDKFQVRIRTFDTDAGRISLWMISGEQEDAHPAPQKCGGGRDEISNLSDVVRQIRAQHTGRNNWKNLGKNNLFSSTTKTVSMGRTAHIITVS